MSLDKDQVQHIAMLARLRLADDEFAETVDKLSRIASQRLRPDQVTEPDDRDHVQENAPLVQDGLYLVPKVIE